MMNRFLLNLRMPLLWSLLNKPPTPFLTRLFHFNPKSGWWDLFAVGAVYTFMMLFCGVTFITGTPIAPLFISGLLLGLISAVGMNVSINNLRQRGTFDLMALTPNGQIGSSLMIAAHFARTHPALGSLRQILLFVQLCVFLIVLVGGGSIGLAIVMGGASMSRTDWFMLTNGLIFLLLMRADYMYSIVTGALIALISTTRISERTTSAIFSGAIFLTLQMSLYVVFVLNVIGINLLLNLDQHWFLMSLSLLVLYIMVREVAVTVLWGVAADHLGTNFAELLILEKEHA